jgi:hypothetical protein
MFAARLLLDFDLEVFLVKFAIYCLRLSEIRIWWRVVGAMC